MNAYDCGLYPSDALSNVPQAKYVQCVNAHCKSDVLKLKVLLASMVLKGFSQEYRRLFFRDMLENKNEPSAFYLRRDRAIRIFIERAIKEMPRVHLEDVALIIFIDVTAEDNGEDLMHAIRELLQKIEASAIFIRPRFHVNAVYARSMLFNFVVNAYKNGQGFVMSFSDDDDLSCDLETLSTYASTIIDKDLVQVLPVACLMDEFRTTRTLSPHWGMWRYLFPWKSFYKFPLTLDAIPKRGENLRFVERMLKMNAFDAIDEHAPVKYYCLFQGKTYKRTIGSTNKDLYQYMTMLDYRIYKTHEANTTDGAIDHSPYGIYPTADREHRSISVNKLNDYSYIPTILQPSVKSLRSIVGNSSTKIVKWNVSEDGKTIYPTFEERKQMNRFEESVKTITPSTFKSAEEICRRDSSEPLFHPDEVLECIVQVGEFEFHFFTFAMNVKREAKFVSIDESKDPCVAYGETPFVIDSWNTRLHEKEKLNQIFGGTSASLRSTCKFVAIALVVVAAVRIAKRVAQQKKSK